jgi:hypothetical protein
MAIQLNRNAHQSPKLKNTCERRRDLTSSILHNIRGMDSYSGHSLNEQPAYDACQSFDSLPQYDPQAWQFANAGRGHENVATDREQIPTEPGVWRTAKGAIDVVVHPGGTYLKARYNYSGILICVEIEDGSAFVREHGFAPWLVLDSEGNPVPALQIQSLSIDRCGTFSFVTTDGHKTIVQIDGTVKEMEAA